MKSIKEIQKVIIALTMISYKPKGDAERATDQEISAARQAMDVLFWAMGYPNNFKDFAEPIIVACPVKDSDVGRIFAEAMKAHEQHEQEGTVVE